MMSTNDERLSYGEFVVRERERQEKYDWRSRVKEAIEGVNIELARGKRRNYVHTLNILRDILYPLVIDSDNTRDIEHYHSELVDADAEWYWNAVYLFDEHISEYYQTLETADDDPLRDTELSRVQREIEQCFRSIESIAEYEGIISSELSNTVPARGFARELGEHLQQYDFEIGEDVELIDRGKGKLKTVVAGSTGEGKSSAVWHMAQDRYERGNSVISLVDLDEGESMVQDIPQQQELLRDLREQRGLAADFNSEYDDMEPRIRALIPLTPTLEHQNLPFSDEDDEFEVEPFTIPFVDIPKGSIIELLCHSATPTQEIEIRQAYDRVARQHDDYGLDDIAEEIRKREMQDEAFKQRILRTIENLSSMGFIRTKSCPHALDISEVARDTDTVTSFVQKYMENTEQKLMVILCVLGILREYGEEGSEVPDMTLVLNELWQVAPHDKRSSSDRVEAAIQSAIGSRLGEMMRRNRHIGVEIIADTQEIWDIKRDVRTQFSRAVVFTPDEVEDIADEIKGTRSQHGAACADSMVTKEGHAGVVGDAATIKNYKDIHYIAPVRMHPPSWHHFDADEGEFDEGDEMRVNYYDHLSMRTPAGVGVDWAFTPSETVDGDKISPDEHEAELSPMGYFVENYVDYVGEPNASVPKQDIRDAYAQYAETEDIPPLHENKSQFSTRLKDYLPKFDTSKRQGENVYLYIRLNEDGKRLLAS